MCQQVWQVNKLLSSLQIVFKAGDLERMRVISINILFASKLPEIRVTPAQCGWVHICKCIYFMTKDEKVGALKVPPEI